MVLFGQILRVVVIYCIMLYLFVLFSWFAWCFPIVGFWIGLLLIGLFPALAVAFDYVGLFGCFV